MCSTREYQWMQCEHFSHSFVRAQIKKIWKDEKIQFVRNILKITFLSFPLNIFCLCVEWRMEKIIKLWIATWKIFFPISAHTKVKWFHVWWNDWSWLSWNIYMKIFPHAKENFKCCQSIFVFCTNNLLKGVGHFFKANFHKLL